jgi:arylsulfatase A-like enzyme
MGPSSIRLPFPLLALSLALLAGPEGCEGGSTPRTVVLVVVDTLRADRLGTYGNPRATSPHLDRLASDGILYQRAYSQAPWTTASIGSLLTSQYPRTLGIRGERSRLDESWTLLPELFQRRGYATGAVVSHTFCSRQWGFDQGFDSFDESATSSDESRIAATVSDRALSFLDANRDRPVFLFLHYFDPHFTYVEHPDFAFDAAPGYTGPVRERVHSRSLTRLRDQLTPADVVEMQRIHDSEVAFVDHHLGRVFERLREQGRYDDALVVVTADHGEEFLEHGNLGHGRTLYDEQLHVPLIVKYPGRQGQVVEHPVALLDVYPTVAEVAGLALTGEERGRPLREAGKDPARAIVSETERFGSYRTLRVQGFKLIEDTESRTRRLFDLADDPGELRNVAADHRQRLREMEHALEQWRAANPRPEEFSTLEISEEERERLRRLGYLEGS